MPSAPRQEGRGGSSAKPVLFVSTLKKAGGARPQRGSKGEEVTPVPGGGGAGGEVRNEPAAPIITRRPQSTNPSPFCPHLVCLFLLNRPRSLALTDPPGSCRLSAALHVSLPEAETQQRAPHSALDCKSKTTPAILPAEFLSFQTLIHMHIYIYIFYVNRSETRKGSL